MFSSVFFFSSNGKWRNCDVFLKKKKALTDPRSHSIMKEKRSQVPFPVFVLCLTDGGALILCRERSPLVILEAGKALERLPACLRALAECSY